MERSTNLDTLAPRTAGTDDAIARFAERHGTADPFVAGCLDADLPIVITDARLPDNPIVFVNAAFEALTGYTPDEILGRNCRFLQGPRTDPAAVAELRDAIRARRRITVDLLNHRKDGSPFWNRLLVTPVFDDGGEVRHYFASQHDVTIERELVVRLEAEQRQLLSDAERVRARLADSEARLDFALQAGQLGTWALEPGSRHLDASGSCKAAFGHGPDDPFAFSDFERAVHPEDRARVLAAVDATLATGVPYDIEYRIMTPAGEQRWLAVRGELLRRGDGSPLSMTGFVTDVSAKKHAEEHQRLLAGELTHRVKNTLATVSAVVNQTLRNAGTLEEASVVVGGRIASLATAHELLIRDEVEGAAVADIVAGVLHPYGGGGGRLYTAAGPTIRLSPAITLALSMALHELATNAAKYGALSVPGGTVAIRWDLRQRDGRRCFSFTWTESGGPPVAPPTRRGFGSRMIERVMAQHLGGTARIDYRPNGVVFAIDAPM